MQSKEQDDSWIGQVVGDMKQALSTQPHWSTSFIHSEGNEVAYKLAKMTLQVERTSWNQ